MEEDDTAVNMVQLHLHFFSFSFLNFSEVFRDT